MAGGDAVGLVVSLVPRVIGRPCAWARLCSGPVVADRGQRPWLTAANGVRVPEPAAWVTGEQE